MNELPVSPDTLAWLGERFGYVEGSALTPEEHDEGVERAERIIKAWARNHREAAFLDALAAGHEIAEARRLSSLSRAKADSLLKRIRGISNPDVSDTSHTLT